MQYVVVFNNITTFLISIIKYRLLHEREHVLEPGFLIDMLAQNMDQQSFSQSMHSVLFEGH